MAKITPSAIITGLSGSVGQATFRQVGNSIVLSKKCRNVVASTDTRQRMLSIYRSAQEYVKTVDEWVYAQASQLLTLFPKYAGNSNSLDGNIKSYLANFLFYRYLRFSNFFYEITYYPSPVWPSLSKVVLSGGSLYVHIVEPQVLDFGVITIFASNRKSRPINYRSRYTSYMHSYDLGTTVFNISSYYISRFGVLPALGDYICVTLVCFDTDSGHISSDITGWIQVTAS